MRGWIGIGNDDEPWREEPKLNSHSWVRFTTLILMCI
jgi:hypothetical protein